MQVSFKLHACPRASVYVCACIRVSTCRVSFSVTLYLMFWDSRCHWTWNSLIWLGWLASQPKDPPIYLSRHASPCFCFIGPCGSELWTSHLSSVHLPREHFPSLSGFLFTKIPFSWMNHFSKTPPLNTVIWWWDSTCTFCRGSRDIPHNG